MCMQSVVDCDLLVIIRLLDTYHRRVMLSLCMFFVTNSISLSKTMLIVYMK